jgi:DNA-binding response OmpR family regulator
MAVVDNDQDTLLALGVAPEQAGYAFLGARSAAAFFAIHEPSRLPDARVVSLGLPDTNGYQIVERLRVDSSP